MQIDERVRISRPGHEVWEVVGNLDGIAGWCPGIRSSRLVGDERLCELDGTEGRLVERILAFDEGRWSYEYEIVDGPYPLEEHRAQMQVVAVGRDACEVRWSAVVEPDATAAAVAQVFRGGLAALQARLEPSQ